MSDKKIRTFSIFLLLGIATLFVPVTALQNSIANAQEYYNQEYEENGYYNQEYDPYKDDNNNKNAPIINVEKKLFICNNVTDTPDFECAGARFVDNPEFFLPAGPDSGEYIPCNDEICPFIDESEFGVQIFKDVATVRELSPEGTPVNLDKVHYTVTERFLEDKITTNEDCSDVGFTHSISPSIVTNDSLIFYNICVDYVGDCEGTIYPGEVKTCTVENYIYEQSSFPIQIVGNSPDDTQSSLQQSNNQALQPQHNILRDIFSD